MKIIAKTKYNDKYWLVWTTDFMDGYKPKSIPGTNINSDNDIQVILQTSKGKRLADAICHYGSYGCEQGLWEIMMENPPKAWGDSVKGYLTWKEIEKYFNLVTKT